MDATGFDTLARTLVSCRSRRAAVLGLAAAVLPAALRADDDPCRPRRKRGEECENECQCRGDYHCGQPRLEAQRKECGQPNKAKQVCCLKQGDSCAGNDCACCGNMACEQGRCRDGCKRDGDCALGKRCLANGTCAIPCNSPADCRSGCLCSAPGGVCLSTANRASCSDAPPDCQDHSDCPVGTYCNEEICGIGRIRRLCQPVCGV